MRILIRDRSTGRYLHGDEWISARAQAFDFRSTAGAFERALEFRGADLELVLAFDDPSYDLAIPVWPTHSKSSHDVIWSKDAQSHRVTR